MRKFLAILLLICIIFTLSACGNKSTENVGKDNVQVGFIYLHDENSTYDSNFLNAAKAACEQAGVPYINKIGIPEGSECYDAAAELVDEGCNIVFADSFGHEDYMIQAARDYPDVEFCHATGTKAHTEDLPNYHNAFAAIYEGRFLAGIAAGMKLNEMIEEGKITEDQALIGYVGAFPYAEVISGYTSFFLGARYICPSATMEVQFTGSWYDEAVEKEVANHLINDGCVLISQHADSMGAPSACELANIPNVSYNGSTIEACPNTFIISSRIDWTPYFLYIINCVKNGEAIDTDWTGSIASGSVKLTEVNNNVNTYNTNINQVYNVENNFGTQLDSNIQNYNPDSTNIISRLTASGNIMATVLNGINGIELFTVPISVMLVGIVILAIVG